MQARSRHTVGVKGRNTADYEESTSMDEKELKIQRDNQKRLESLIFCVLVIFTVVGIISQWPTKIKTKDSNTIRLPGSIPSSPVSVGGNGLKDTTNNIRLGSRDLRNPEMVEVPELAKKQQEDTMTLDELQKLVDDKEEEVRTLKRQKGIIMETDPKGTQLTKELQVLTRKLIWKRYQSTTFRIQVDIKFPSVITEKDGKPPNDSFFIELASIDLIPVSVYYYLELVRDFRIGHFIRNAAHVLQAHTQTKKGGKKPMPFQEYSRQFPHEKYTTGYAGRPSGPQWYISIMNNTDDHGPGTQQKQNQYEADSLFGKLVLDGRTEVSVIPRIHSTPQKEFLDEKNYITITNMTILVPMTPQGSNTDKWIPWGSKLPIIDVTEDTADEGEDDGDQKNRNKKDKEEEEDDGNGADELDDIGEGGIVDKKKEE